MHWQCFLFIRIIQTASDDILKISAWLNSTYHVETKNSKIPSESEEIIIGNKYGLFINLKGGKESTYSFATTGDVVYC